MVERRPIFQGNPISVGGILKLLALLALIAAFCVAEGWLTKGTWQEWIAGGLALWCASEIV